jgi:hypothetical protein
MMDRARLTVWKVSAEALREGGPPKGTKLSGARDRRGRQIETGRVEAVA